MSGGVKVPGLEVRSPKGTAKPRKEERNQEITSGRQEEEEGRQEPMKQEEEENVSHWVQGRVEPIKRYRGEAGMIGTVQDTEEQKVRKQKKVRIEGPGKKADMEAKRKPKNFLEVLMASRYQQANLPCAARTPVRKKIQSTESSTVRCRVAKLMLFLS